MGHEVHGATAPLHQACAPGRGGGKAKPADVARGFTFKPRNGDAAGLAAVATRQHHYVILHGDGLRSSDIIRPERSLALLHADNGEVSIVAGPKRAAAQGHGVGVSDRAGVVDMLVERPAWLPICVE